MILFAFVLLCCISHSSFAAKASWQFEKLVLSRNSRRFSTCWESVPGPSSAPAFIALGTEWSFLVWCGKENVIFLQILQIQMLQILQIQVLQIHTNTNTNAVAFNKPMQWTDMSVLICCLSIYNFPFQFSTIYNFQAYLGIWSTKAAKQPSSCRI